MWTIIIRCDRYLEIRPPLSHAEPLCKLEKGAHTALQVCGLVSRVWVGFQLLPTLSTRALKQYST